MNLAIKNRLLQDGLTAKRMLAARSRDAEKNFLSGISIGHWEGRLEHCKELMRSLGMKEELRKLER